MMNCKYNLICLFSAIFLNVINLNNIIAQTETGQSCKDSEWACTNGTCIPASWRCDTISDCVDSSDEIGCTCDNGFQCNTTGICIAAHYKCNGFSECTDGSDERDCIFCWEGLQFQCNSTIDCIASSWRCDGESDCPDGSDEIGCECVDGDCATNDTANLLD